MKASEFLTKVTPTYRKIFEELARRVGVTLEELELTPDEGTRWGWPYDKYSWSEAEEQEFRKWLEDYMYQNRKKLELGYSSKGRIKRYEVPFFLLMYSWKDKEK